MTPETDFKFKEKYRYLEGSPQYHHSEYFEGAYPRVNNHPQKPPYGLRTERLSNSSFAAPRDQTLHTWMYRSRISLEHGPFSMIEPAPPAPDRMTPNAVLWPGFSSVIAEGSDWTNQALLAGNGDPSNKTGFAIWLFRASKSMPPKTAYSSSDGDFLIVPQSGTLDIQTELGKLLLRQNEIAVIPRGLRYRVMLPDGPARGYICEAYQGHFRLPDLGIVGTHGLANLRDFQVPRAHFDGWLENGVATPEPGEGDWTMITRQRRALWSCRQDHSPFDVAAWHGTSFPYKFDLAKFCVLGNALFDEHDPSLYTVLQISSHREPGHSLVDFAIVPPRWQVSEDSLWLPYCHRNTCTEFTAPIINAQDEDHVLNRSNEKNEFRPFGAVLHNPMTVHGVVAETIDEAAEQSTAPTKLQNDGATIFLLESELPILMSEWAEKGAVENYKKGFRGFPVEQQP